MTYKELFYGLCLLGICLAACVNNVCTLPISCESGLDNGTYCAGCINVTSVPNINYSNCSLLLNNFYSVNITDDGIYKQINITNTQYVLIARYQQINGSLSIQYNTSLNFQINSVLEVDGGIYINGIQSYSTVLLSSKSITTTQFLMITEGNISIQNIVINTSNMYCTQMWASSNAGIIQPWLTFSYNPSTFQYSAITNLSLVNQSFIQQYFSLALISSQQILITGTTINTSLLLAISTDLTIDSSSIINASSMGCQSNNGAGRGLNVTYSQGCNNSGASGSGYGGYGTNDSLCFKSIQFFQFILHSFPYGIVEEPAVSGSAGINPNGMCTGEGAGGGIVIIQTANTTTMNGMISVNGGFSNESSCSAGSAGSVNIFSSTMTGSGSISAVGGASNNSGEGSGGWIKIFAFNNQPTFGGSVQIGAGLSYPGNYTADNGSLFTANCPAGSGFNSSNNTFVMQCNPCATGYYKAPLNTQCIQCPNLNQLELSTFVGNTNVSRCYTGQQVNRNFFGLKDMTRQIYFFQILTCFGLILLFSCIGIVLRKKYKRKKSRLQTESFDFEKATQDINNSKIITENLKNEKDFKMADLMYHVHRISVFGTNIYDNPWVLSQNPPQQLHGIIVNDSYELFATNLNQLMHWKSSEKYLLYFSFIIYPIYWYLLIFLKKQKYKKVVKFIETTKINFINQELHEDRNLIKIKVSKNTDYTICYIDIFRYNRADLKYFMLSCPYIVYLSGEGNFIRPFYLCQTDPFLNVLYFIVNRNIEKGNEEVSERYRLMGNLVNQKKRLENSSKLSKFIRHFNRSSCTLDLDSPVKNFIHGVELIIELLNTWNKEFFNQFSVQVNLLLITTKFQGNRIVDHSISILQGTDKKTFDRFMTKALEELKELDKYDIKFAIFIYNPGQDMEEFNRERHRETLSMVEVDTSHKPTSLKDESIEEPLLDEKKKKPNKMTQCLQKFSRIIGFVRYNFISHRASNTSKYVLEFLQIVLILFDASFVVVWQNWLTYPFVGFDYAAPFVGVIWITSGNSYGVGKMFLIFNAMAFFNEFVQLIITAATWSSHNWLYKTLRLIALLLQMAIIAIGCRMITYSKKLNQPKIA